MSREFKPHRRYVPSDKHSHWISRLYIIGPPEIRGLLTLTWTLVGLPVTQSVTPQGQLVVFLGRFAFVLSTRIQHRALLTTLLPPPTNPQQRPPLSVNSVLQYGMACAAGFVATVIGGGSIVKSIMPERVELDRLWELNYDRVIRFSSILIYRSLSLWDQSCLLAGCVTKLCFVLRGLVTQALVPRGGVFFDGSAQGFPC